MWKWTKHPVAKTIFQCSRWCHVYVSTLLFSLLLFFSITGITLNHLEWLKEDTAQQAMISRSITNTDQQGFFVNPIEKKISLDAVTQYVEMHLDLHEPREVSYEKELQEITLDYPLPAGYAFVTILLEEGMIEVEHEYAGLMALLNDLHKGRHTGVVWQAVIDVSAILIVFFSVTGLIILFQLGKRRAMGLALITIGTLVPCGIYFLSVPTFG